MNAPTLPDTARAILKTLIVSLASTGLISNGDAENLITAMGLTDA